jgi:hypothetical protein
VANRGGPGGENVSVRAFPSRFGPTTSPALAAALALAIALVGAVSGCAAGPPPVPAAVESPAPPVEDAQTQLAARAAAAQDRAFTARYTLAGGGSTRTVTATRAADGTWRVDIPGGALGGTADISLGQLGGTTYSCALPSAALPTCVRLAGKGQRIPARYDPRVEHPFSDWIGVLIDRNSPLSVSVSPPLPGAKGTCYAVESISAQLAPPMDAGIYCYADDGLLTAARAGFGTLMLDGAAAPGPATINLAGPVVVGEPLGMAAPPPPPPPPTPATGTPPRAGRPTATGAGR